MAPVAVFGILDLEFPWKLGVGIWNFDVMALLFKKNRDAAQCADDSRTQQRHRLTFCAACALRTPSKIL